MEGAAAMARASERLGFFDLPREIRDEIYRLTFSKSYNLPINGGKLGAHDILLLIKTPSYGGPSASHILQVSRRLRFEAEEILFNDSTFRLRLSLSKSSQHSLSRELADRLMNPCIYMPHRISTRHHYDYNYQILEIFGGSRVGRKTCTIIFYPHSLVHWVTDTRLFSVLKTFTAYKTVRIQASGPSTLAQQWLLQDNIRSMGKVLEYDLGDAVAFEDGNTRGLEFHPQDRAFAHNA
ncbi:hypothetical protein BDR22DRAFT_433403 [Usnea florida]